MLISDSDTVPLPTTGGAMQTHVFRPTAPGRYPGVIFYSEIFQVTGPIRRAAAMVAGQGYVVLVPEIYHELEAPGTVLSYTPEGSARGNAHKTNKSLSAYDADTQACVRYLQESPWCTGAIGTLGMCLGGHLAMRAALSPQIRAAACLYPTDLHKRVAFLGQQDDTLDRVGEIGAELLLVFGRQDPHIPVEGRRAVYAALTQADRHFEWHEFNAAHAFMRDEGNRYNPQIAQLVHQLIVDLFRRTLSQTQA